MVLKVAVGTLVFDSAGNVLLADLKRPGQRLLVAQGGRGGRGHLHFWEARYQAAPAEEEGGAGREPYLPPERKRLAGVGAAGVPQSGKAPLFSVFTGGEPP